MHLSRLWYAYFYWKKKLPYSREEIIIILAIDWCLYSTILSIFYCVSYHWSTIIIIIIIIVCSSDIWQYTYLENIYKMFHIFRWRRDRRNASTTPSELLSVQENKNAHSRRHRLHVYHGAHSIERLFHVKRHRSPSEHDKHQVIKNEKNIQ